MNTSSFPACLFQLANYQLGWAIPLSCSQEHSTFSRYQATKIWPCIKHKFMPAFLYSEPDRGHDAVLLLSVGGRAISEGDILHIQMNQKSNCHQSREDTFLPIPVLSRSLSTSLPFGPQEQIQLTKLVRGGMGKGEEKGLPYFLLSLVSWINLPRNQTWGQEKQTARQEHRFPPSSASAAHTPSWVPSKATSHLRY